MWLLRGIEKDMEKVDAITGYRFDDAHSSEDWVDEPSRPWTAEYGKEAAFALPAGHMPDWIVDTGAAYHLRQTSTADPKKVRKAYQPRSVRSANGEFTMGQEAITYIPALGNQGEGLTTHLWDSTPKRSVNGPPGTEGGLFF